MPKQKVDNFSAMKLSVNMMSKILPMPYGTDMVTADEMHRHATEAPITHRSGWASASRRRNGFSCGFSFSKAALPFTDGVTLARPLVLRVQLLELKPTVPSLLVGGGPTARLATKRKCGA